MRLSPRRAFTLFQLLVVIAILLILLALLLPALQKVREAAARAQSQNNLHQIGIAIQNYADTYQGMIPPGVDAKNFSTVAYILPFIEQNNLFKSIDFKKSIDDEANAAARKTQLKTFLSPSDPILAVKPEWGATNYLFNDQTFVPLAKLMPRFPASITDGTSNTILAAETLKGDGDNTKADVHRKYVLLKKEDLKKTGPNTGTKYFKDGTNLAGDRCASWMDGRFLQGTFNDRMRPNDERPDVSCGGVSGVSAPRTFGSIVNVGMFDGSVHAVSADISYATWKAAMTPSNGDILGNDW
jgi:type II secretory pathway pseudopilin PulG